MNDSNRKHNNTLKEKTLEDVIDKEVTKELLNEMVVVVSGSGLPPKGMKNAQDNFVLALNEIIHLANLKNSIIGTNTS
jgi:hypothetical protein